LPDIPPPHADGGLPHWPSGSSEPPPGAPAPRRGLPTGAMVALVIVAVILLVYGICVTVISQSGSSG